MKPQIVRVATEGDKVVYTFGQNVAPILSQNQQLRRTSDENWQRDKDMKLVARVPKTLWLQWEQLGITKDPVALAKAIELHKEVKTTEKRLI